MTDNRAASIVALTWPIFVELFLRLLIGNVNVLMLSNYSDEAVAAVGVASQVSGMLMMLFSVVAAGTAILISQYLGAGKREAAARSANLALVLCSALGVIVGGLVLLGSRSVLTAMRLKGLVLNYANRYLLITGVASFAPALSCAQSAVSRSYGHTNYPMVVALGMNVLNVVGNCVVVFRPFGLPDFGVGGVAVVSIASQLVSVAAMAAILRRRLGVRLSLRDLKPFPMDLLRKILRVGLPAAGDNASYNLCQLVITAIVATLGTAAISTKIYAQNVVFFVYAFGLALGQASQIKVGHLVGAGKVEEAFHDGLRYLRYALLANCTLSLVCALFRVPLIGIYSRDAEVIRLGGVILILDFFVETGRAFNNILSNSLRGSGDVRFPVAVSVASSWTVCIGLCYLLAIQFDLGLPGVWVAFACDEWFRGLILLGRWRSRAWFAHGRGLVSQE